MESKNEREMCDRDGAGGGGVCVACVCTLSMLAMAPRTLLLVSSRAAVAERPPAIKSVARAFSMPEDILRILLRDENVFTSLFKTRR